MHKKLSSMLCLTLCAIHLAAALPAKECVPVGLRAESFEKRIEQLESRANAAALHQENEPTDKLSNFALARSVFFTSHPGVFQNPLSVSFNTVELTDGSIWEVSPSDANILPFWSATDYVCISPNHSWFSHYAFLITNQHTGDTVGANLKLGPVAPVFNNVHTHWITAIDYYYNTIYLDDGSYWNMSSWDSTIIDQWIPGDIVIIGLNDGWLSSYSPNILINVAMLNFAAGNATL